MQNWRELLENHSFLGLLEPVTLGVVLVVALKSLDLNVVVEGLLQVLQSLNIQLNI